MTLEDLQRASAQALAWLLLAQAAVNFIVRWFPQWLTIPLGLVGVVWTVVRSERSDEAQTALARVTGSSRFFGKNMTTRGREILFDVSGEGFVEVDGLIDEGPHHRERPADRTDEAHE